MTAKTCIVVSYAKVGQKNDRSTLELSHDQGWVKVRMRVRIIKGRLPVRVKIRTRVNIRVRVILGWGLGRGLDFD